MQTENIKIRKASIEDLDNILRLSLILFKKEYKEFDKSLDLDWTYSKNGKEYFKYRITRNDGFVEIAEHNGKIIAYIGGGISKGQDYRKKARYAELENMLVEKKFRGKGIGGELISNFLVWCKKNKVNYVSVTASTKNKQALVVYKKLGFSDYDTTLEMKLR